MNSGQVYAKTPIGDEAVRQSTRVVQRNLRMVLVQVDGKMTVGELGAKIGNVRLVESAIDELERGGYIVPLAQAAAAWELGKPRSRKEQLSAISQFSTFGSGVPSGPVSLGAQSQSSRFSSFGKPVLPASVVAAEPLAGKRVFEPELDHEEGSSGRAPRLLAWGGASLLLLVLLLVAFFPYNNFRADIENALTDLLEMPVTVGDVSLKFLPSPHFALGDVGIGDTRDGRIDVIEIHQPLGFAFSGAAGVKDVTVVGASIPVRRLLALPAIGNARALPLPAVRQLILRDLRLNAGASAFFGTFNGRLLLSSGQLESAALETPDRSVLITAKPLASGIELSVEGRAWRVPGIPVNFPSFQAKGLLQDGSLQLREIDASFLGGLLKGDWTLNWGAGLSMAGSGEMTRLDLRRLASDLAPQLTAEGDLNGSIRIAGSGDDWRGLWHSATAQLRIDVTRGLLNGIDVGEAARRGAGAIVRSGTTRFDRLLADVGVDAQGVSMRDIRLDSGLLTTSGQLQVSAAGEVNGSLVVLARSSVSTTRVPLAISGSLPGLTLTAGR
jgi:hypothetical protein